MNEIILPLASFNKRLLQYAQKFRGFDLPVQDFRPLVERIGQFDVEQVFEKRGEFGEWNDIALAVHKYICAVDRGEQFDQVMLGVPLRKMNVVPLDRRGRLE